MKNIFDFFLMFQRNIILHFLYIFNYWLLISLDQVFLCFQSMQCNLIHLLLGVHVMVKSLMNKTFSLLYFDYSRRSCQKTKNKYTLRQGKIKVFDTFSRFSPDISNQLILFSYTYNFLQDVIQGWHLCPILCLLLHVMFYLKWFLMGFYVFKMKVVSTPHYTIPCPNKKRSCQEQQIKMGQTVSLYYIHSALKWSKFFTLKDPANCVCLLN